MRWRRGECWWLKNKWLGVGVMMWGKLLEVRMVDVGDGVGVVDFVDFGRKIWNVVERDECGMMGDWEVKRENVVKWKLGVMRGVGWVIVDGVFVDVG